MPAPGASACGWSAGSATERIDEERAAALLAAIDIGPVRTLQQDVEFGIVQIVDIGLRAISPAVNDPTTAISCVDQLSSLLIRWLNRAPPIGRFFDPPHVLRVVVPWIDLEGMLDLAFEQLRHYAEADAAVSLRLVRALGDIAGTVEDPAVHRVLLERSRRVVAGCEGKLSQDDLARLAERLAHVETGGAGDACAPAPSSAVTADAAEPGRCSVFPEEK